MLFGKLQFNDENQQNLYYSRNPQSQRKLSSSRKKLGISIVRSRKETPKLNTTDKKLLIRRVESQKEIGLSPIDMNKPKSEHFIKLSLLENEADYEFHSCEKSDDYFTRVEMEVWIQFPSDLLSQWFLRTFRYP